MRHEAIGSYQYMGEAGEGENLASNDISSQMEATSSFHATGDEGGANWDFDVAKKEQGVALSAKELEELNNDGLVAYLVDTPDTSPVRNPIKRAFQSLGQGISRKALKLAPIPLILTSITMACGGSEGEDVSPPPLDTRVLTPLPTGEPTITTEPPSEVPSEVPTDEPTVEPTEVPTAEPTAEVPPPYGKYQTIEEMPGSASDKESIARLLEGSTPFIITDNVIVAVENDLMTRPDTIIWFGKEEKASQLHSIQLNTEDFPDAAEKLEMARKLGMYKAWRVADNANLRVTFEEYLERSKTEDLSFPLRMWDETGTTEIKGFVKDDMKLIINFVADDSMSLKRVGGAIETSEQIIGNALRLNILSPDPASIGEYSDASFKAAQYTSAINIAFPLASWRFPELLTIGKGNIDSNLLLGDVEELYEYLVPEQTNTEWNSIFTVE